LNLSHTQIYEKKSNEQVPLEAPIQKNDAYDEANAKSGTYLDDVYGC
jgi:hypothetical protein